MTPLPKPSPRPKAKRAPIARKSRLDRGAPPQRRTRVRKMKAGATAEMRRDCTRLCSLICRELAGHRCEYREPGMPRCAQLATDAAHTLAKGSHPAVRFVLLCLIALCRRHHDLMTEACVARPSAMGDLFKLLRGLDAWETLVCLSRKPAPYLPDVHARLKATAQAMGLEKA